MQTRIIGLAALCILTFVTGCALQYQFDGVTYVSRADALAAQRQQLDAVLAAIAPVLNPLGGRATVILPSAVITDAKAVNRTGNASTTQDEAAGYVAEILMNAWDANIDGLRRGQVFASVTTVLSDAPANSAKSAGGDFVIWLDLVDKNTAQWYGVGSTGNVVALPVDTGAPLGAPRLQKWVNLVSEALADFNEPAPKSTPSRKRT